MTNEKLKALLEGLVEDRNAVSKARDALRHGLTALKTDPRLKRRLTPAGQNEQADELRQAAIARHRDAVTRAQLAAEAVQGMTQEHARTDELWRARLVPEPTAAEIQAVYGPYPSPAEIYRMRIDAAKLNELSTMRMERTLLRTAPGELAERAKRAVASGTEAGVAEYALIRQVAAERGDLGEHRVPIENCIDALRLPAADAEQVELVTKITAVAGAVARNYDELVHTTAAPDEGKFASVDRDQEYIEAHGHQAFRDSAHERHAAEREAVKQTADTMLRAAVLEEIKTEGEA